MILNKIRKINIYTAIQQLHETKGYQILELCKIANISRNSYYKWLNRVESKNEKFNKELVELIKDAYIETNGILGYRQMTMKLNRENDFHINHKRIYRLMKMLDLKSVCSEKGKKHQKVSAKNILNRKFSAENFGEKWLTDVTEMKYGANSKAYLSAILDLSDKSIVAFKMGRSNNKELVFKTFDMAHKKFPDAKPLFHTDRGAQYTTLEFKLKLDEAGMTQSMSRVWECFDNSPMEAFWSRLKSEMYYLNKFKTYAELETAVEEYIEYYNQKRCQIKLKGMTPMEYRDYLKKINV